MKTKKDLEEAIKDKLPPLLGEMLEKHIGLTIPKLESDISDQLTNPHLNIYVPQHLTFSQAKKTFKSEFLKRELQLHKGNISNLAKKLAIDRRSIHRAIKELDINRLAKGKISSLDEYQEEVVDQTLRSTLEQYKEIIHPQKMEKMYEEVPALSRNIAKFLPHQEWTWKEAESEFEKQFLKQALGKHQWKISEAAKALEIRAETLHRKVKRLRLR